MLFSRTALVASLLGVANAVPVASSLSCVDDASDGQSYNGFVVQCGIDYNGNDMGLAWTSTFEDCIDTCASTSGCVDVSYSGTACYMKSGIGVYTINGVWGAVKAATSTLTCPSADGQVYDGFTIACGIDHVGGDLSNFYAGSLNSCLDTCSTTADCLGVAYAAPYCYMKSTINEPSSNPAIIAATLPPSNTGLCANGNTGTSTYSAGGKSFNVVCGWDYYGYDISNQQTKDLETCISRLLAGPIPT
ncbi:hypothetical protein PV08_02226 [Exophiala spinifera]|uniref:Apple domain-containing protein n=1 Tax=Exophiala spinifera TaxID=91928 RepID=A0A0D1Z1V9_9EURO|nr:uncharacterized protein PV08_02226 [Exophiala spinifera]KIW21646.1 hypothetical protein PV08_02226 [Exophiala spinifera]